VKRGFALVTVLAVGIMISLGAATILQSMSSLGKMRATNLKEVRARYIAEAGMQHALYVCRTNPGGCASVPGFTVRVFMDGGWVNVPAPITVYNLGPGRYDIRVNTQYADA